jgi:WD40 repeat protein
MFQVLTGAVPVDSVLATMTMSDVSDTTSRPVFDVFLSHNRREQAIIERIAEKLKREAVEPWLDKWCLTPGGDWQDEIAYGLRCSSSCAVFVGPGGIGDWERMEFKLATDRMAKDRNFRVFLVFLPGLPEPFDTGSLPPFLSTRTWVDMRKGIDDPSTFQTFINAVKGVASGPQTPIEPRDDICPYRGLRAFDEEHSEFFFGREGDVQRLVEKLKATRFLTVVGPSGSGKSSVVRAGLLPALYKGALPASDAWPVRVFTPGALPLTSLAANIVRLYPQSSAVKTLDELSADERALHLMTSCALVARPQSERVVWVIDQFEEVFTLCQDEAERAKFIANLLYAAAVPGGRSAVVLTMRADFYQKCAAYPELSAQVAAQQFLVSPMNADGLRQAIAEPAWRVGLEFERGLVETILNDVESEPGALPLLEHALLELWERRRGRMLTLEAYRETGGVEGAIAKRADAIFESFDAGRQSIARRVMLRLTQPGEGTEDTRRRATMAELITRLDEAEKVRDVVTALADARLLTTDSGAEEGSEVVDVSHEALIRGWPRLRQWVEEDRHGLRTHRRLTEAAQEWQRSGRDEGLLFRGARLAQATEWRERNQPALNELERGFLDVSGELQARERLAAQRRTRRIVTGLVAALILISAATIYALIQSRLATRRGNEAFARELAANALAQLPVNPELSLRLAIKAAKTGQIVETENTLRQVLARSPLHVLHTGLPASSHNPTATFALGGKLIAVTNDKTFQAFDAETGGEMIRQSYDYPVRRVVSSPGGRLIAIWVNDYLSNGTVDIWEAGTGQNVATLQIMNQDYDVELVFSPDDRFLVTTWSGQSLVWEVDTKSVVAELEGQGAVFSRDGKLLLTKEGYEEGKDKGGDTLFVTDTTAWKRVTEIPSPPKTWSRREAFGALSPDGKYVVARTRDGRVRLYESRSGHVVRELKLIDVENAEIAAFSPDGRYVAFALNATPVLWDTSSEVSQEMRAGTRALSADTNLLSGLSFSRDGRSLLTVGDSARIHDLKSGRVLAEYRAAGGGTVLTAEFNPDGKTVLTINDDGTACVWDLSVSSARTVRLADSLASPERQVSSMIRSPEGTVVSPDGTLVADIVILEGGQFIARVRELASGRDVQLLTHAKHLYSVAFSPDSRLILTTDYTSARVWELGSGHILSELRHGEMLRGAAYSPDGKLVVTVSDDVAKVWNTSDGQLVEEIPSGDEGAGAIDSVASAAFSPDGRRVLITVAGQARVWELGGRGVVLKVGEGHKFGGGITRAIYGPDARYILTWEQSGDRFMANSIQVRSADTGRVVVDLNGHVDSVRSATFSTDGEYVMTMSGSETDENTRPPDAANEVRVWDLRSGSTFCEFRDHDGPIVNGAFGLDGKSLWAADVSGAVYVYACKLCAQQDELLKLAEKRSVRQLTRDERVRYLHESGSD